MVSINELTLRITTDIGVLCFEYETPDDLSEALLVLSLQGTKRVDYLDEVRFNPARFLDCYKGQRRVRAVAAQ